MTNSCPHCNGHGYEETAEAPGYAKRYKCGYCNGTGTWQNGRTTANILEAKMTLQEQFEKYRNEMRPCEPYSESENPEQWASVLTWQEEYSKWLETKLQNTSSNSDYAAAVKKLINSDVDCVQTKNGAYVNLDGVVDSLNRALHDFA